MRNNKTSTPHALQKGGTKRTSPIAFKVEPWAKDALLADAAPGESQADVFHRWAGEKRDAKGGVTSPPTVFLVVNDNTRNCPGPNGTTNWDWHTRVQVTDTREEADRRVKRAGRSHRVVEVYDERAAGSTWMRGVPA